jgi:hypothetical protein
MAFPVFEEQEFLTAEKLNAFVQSLEDKFSAGLTSVDLSWPLVAEGNIVMGSGATGHSIIGGKAIFKVVNADAYDTFQAAVTAAGAGGGVFVPPNTTITTQGVVLPDRFALFGAGPSSVLRVEGGAGYLLATALGASTGLLLANLTLDGNDVLSQRGLLIRGHQRAVISNVRFQSFDAEAVAVDPGSATGNLDIHISNCRFDGGGDHHINITSVERMSIKDCTFEDTSDGSAIRLVPAAANKGRDIVIRDCQFRESVGHPVLDLQGRTAVSDDFSNVSVSGCRIDGTSVGTNYVVRFGTTTNPLSKSKFVHSVVENADDSGGVLASCEDVLLAYNTVLGSGTIGVSMGESDRGFVQANYVSGFTTAFSMADAANLVVRDNVFSGTTNVAYGAGPNYDTGNIGSPTIVRSTTNNEVTVPANRVGPGSVIRTSRTIRGGSAGPGTMDLVVGGKTVATVTGIGSGDNARIDSELYVLSTTTIRANVQLFKIGDWGHTTTVITGIDTTAAFVISSSNPGVTSSFRHGLRVEYVGNNYEELP